MALRVLLADESTTIKKVMQLALQDFAVEVKSVQSGIDVLEVAKSFQPDIIFADVLLQKKNGYEVCADVKEDPEHSQIPVVLMWSSFMDLDEHQASACHADRRLEKPFDVENLRQIVLELVPKTRSQRLAHFLKFPETVTEPLAEEEQAKAQAQTQAPAPPPPVPPPPVGARPKPAAPQTPPAKTRTPPPPPPQAPPAARQAAPSPAPRPAAPPLQKPPLQKPPPQKPPPATPAAKQASPASWNMDSFEDINEYAAEEEGPKLELEAEEEIPAAAAPRTLPPPVRTETLTEEAEGFEFSPADDDFQEVRISKPLAKRGPLPSPETEEPPGMNLELEADGISEAPAYEEPSSDDNDEAWSHQNLSRFKLDIAGLEGDDVKLDLEQPTAPESLEHGDFLHHKEAVPPPKSAPRTPPRSSLNLTRFDEDTYQLPAESESVPGEAGLPGQLSADRLEEIVRAQSREIIETVVRRIVRDVVPDLATKIIREELNRLLEDSSGRERSP